MSNHFPNLSDLTSSGASVTLWCSLFCGGSKAKHTIEVAGYVDEGEAVSIPLNLCDGCYEVFSAGSCYSADLTDTPD